VREFAATSLTLAQVGQLAWAAQGKTIADGRRTAPSAGALYPIEILVVASRVEGLPAGVYRYVSGSHALERVEGGTAAELARAALGQSWMTEAPVVFAIAGVEARTAVKYGARANRYVMIEAGCVAENLALQAVGLGLGTVLVGAFDDVRVATVLRLRKGEQPVLLVPVGKGR
jgi:SagB-type dehydrogenase family enzyme